MRLFGLRGRSVGADQRRTCCRGARQLGRRDRGRQSFVPWRPVLNQYNALGCRGAICRSGSATGRSTCGSVAGPKAVCGRSGHFQHLAADAATTNLR